MRKTPSYQAEEVAEASKMVPELPSQTGYLQEILVADNDYIIPRSLAAGGPDLHRHQNVLASEFFDKVLDTLPPEKRAQVLVPPARYIGWNMLGPTSIITEVLPLPPGLDVDQYRLVDYFFREVNSLYGILHEAVFRDQLSAFNELAQFDPNETPERYSRATLFRASLYLVYAIAIRLSERPPSNTSALLNERNAFTYGYSVVNQVSFESESFELIQGWLLVTIYLRLSHHQGSVYAALSRATSMAKLMGLRYENPILGSDSLYDKQRARRLFWAVFTIERVLGLHKGNYGAVTIKYIQRQFPSTEYASERDGWLPFPAFALLHVAKVANLVYTTNDAKYTLIESELAALSMWMDTNGLANSDLFASSSWSGLALAQVKLHYYDLILCVHGRVLLNFLGHQGVQDGPSIYRVLDGCRGIIEVLLQVRRASMLWVPWYNTLLLLFNVGITALTLLNAGLFIAESKLLLQESMELLTLLQGATAAGDMEGEDILRADKVSECIDVLRSAQKALALRFEQNRSELFEIGLGGERPQDETSIHSGSKSHEEHFGGANSWDSGTPNLQDRVFDDGLFEPHGNQWQASWMDIQNDSLPEPEKNDVQNDNWMSQWMSFNSKELGLE